MLRCKWQEFVPKIHTEQDHVTVVYKKSDIVSSDFLAGKILYSS